MIIPDRGSSEEGAHVEPTVDGEVDMAIPGTPYISKELHHLYYLVKNKPTTLTCEAYNVDTIKIMCGDVNQMFMIEGIVIEEKSEAYPKSDGNVAFQNVVTGTVTIRKNKLSSKNYNPNEYYCQCIGEYTVAGDVMMKKEGIKAVIEEAKLRDFTTSPMNQFPKEGESVTIQCEIPEGNPVPEITFYKDDEMVTSDNSHIIIMGPTLMITMATMQDSGNYKCMAESVAGTRVTAAALIDVMESDDVDVDVDVEPTPEVEEAATEVPYSEGDEHNETKHSSFDEEMEEKYNSIEIKTMKPPTEKVDAMHVDGNDSQTPTSTEDSTTTTAIPVVRVVEYDVSKHKMEVDDAKMDVNNSTIDEGDHEEQIPKLDTKGKNNVTGTNPNIEGCNPALVTKCTGFAQNTDPSKFCMFAEELNDCVSTCEENEQLLPLMTQMYDSVMNNCKMVSGEGTMTGMPRCPQVEECRKLFSNNLDANDDSSEYKQMCSNPSDDFVDCVENALYECEMPTAAAPLPGAGDSGEWFTSYCEYFFAESSSFEGCDAINSCNLPMNLNVADNNTFWCSMYNSVMKCTEDAINSCGLNALKAHLELMDEMTGTQYGCEIENMPDTDMNTGSEPDPSATPNTGTDDNTKLPEVVEEPGSAATKDTDSGASSISAALVLATCMQLILATLMSWR